MIWLGFRWAYFLVGVDPEWVSVWCGNSVLPHPTALQLALWGWQLEREPWMGSGPCLCLSAWVLSGSYLSDLQWNQTIFQLCPVSRCKQARGRQTSSCGDLKEGVTNTPLTSELFRVWFISLCKNRKLILGLFCRYHEVICNAKPLTQTTSGRLILVPAEPEGHDPDTCQVSLWC